MFLVSAAHVGGGSLGERDNWTDPLQQSIQRQCIHRRSGVHWRPRLPPPWEVNQDDLAQRPLYHTKQGMSHVAEQLGDRIEALHKDGQRAVLEERKTAVRGRNAKAKQLVNRLESCDEVSGVSCHRRCCPHAHNVLRQSIANLLSQAADCLDTLVTNGSSNGDADDEQRKQLFEARAQEWFASLHEVQIGLRSAVKNLRKAQLPPVVHDTSTVSSAAPAASGSASRGHSLALLRGTNAQAGASLSSPSMDGELGTNGPEIPSGEETKLSLSTIRLENAGWKQLADSLDELAAGRGVQSSKQEDDSSPTGQAASSHNVSGASQAKQEQLNAANERPDERLLHALHLLIRDGNRGPSEASQNVDQDGLPA